MAGIYVHIPFCHKACTYCDFHFSTVLKNRDELIDALIREIELRSDYSKDQKIETLYFGGGTPSLLPEKSLHSIMDALHSKYDLAHVKEVTLEANPEDLSKEKLNFLKGIGINRLSIGIQSFREEVLRWMNRSHRADQAVAAVRNAQDAGFENITIDLIYGIPGLTKQDWEEELANAVALQTQHLSAYCLTVEQKTALAHEVKKGMVVMPADEDVAWQFHTMRKVLADSGLFQYEISNFARKGKLSLHNSSYWNRVPYIGLGPSAHSYNGSTRFWNVANNAKYISQLSQGELPIAETEILTIENQINEYIMTGLRTVKGIRREEFTQKLSYDIVAHSGSKLDLFQKNQWMEETQEGWRLTPEGMLRSDALIAELFVDAN